MSTTTPGGVPPASVESSKPQIAGRIQSLDVLRGIAVLCGLIISILIFGGFSHQQQNQLLLQSKGWNYRVFGAVELLFDGKMRALIALVFGGGMVMFLTRETEAGKQSAGDVFIKRQLWLIIFGLANAFLLFWTQDVLFHLGVVGILLFPFFRMKPKGLLIAVLLVTFIYCGKNFWNYSDDKKTYRKYIAVTALEKKYEKDSIAKAQKGIAAKKDTLTSRQKREKQAWEGLLASKKIDPKKDEPTIKAMRSGSYGTTLNHIIPVTQAREASWTYRFGIWDFAGMIFLGMLLYKIGFFSNRFSRGRYLLITLVCLTGGFLMGWYRLHYQQLSLQDYLKYIARYSLPHTFFFPFERAAMALGYASLVAALINVSVLQRVWRGLASVGKLALTNYLMQSLVCFIFFVGYGMGYFGRLSQFQLYFFAAEVIMVQLIFSVLWLRKFNYGPAEWLLRKLSSGKWSKKIHKPSATEPAIPVMS